MLLLLLGVRGQVSRDMKSRWLSLQNRGRPISSAKDTTNETCVIILDLPNPGREAKHQTVWSPEYTTAPDPHGPGLSQRAVRQRGATSPQPGSCVHVLGARR